MTNSEQVHRVVAYPRAKQAAAAWRPRGVAMAVMLVGMLILTGLGVYAALVRQSGASALAAAPVSAAGRGVKEDPGMTEALTPEQLAAAKKKLTPEQYNVCFLRGTEPPGSGKYEKLFDPGTYHCAVCGTELFKSEAKYDSHSGWPAFWDAADKSRLELLKDGDLPYARTEVRCKKCGAHLGHVFNDGPKPTGQRYCINSVALEFVPDKK